MQLADIPLYQLKPFKITLSHRGSRDHSRWVFRGAVRGQQGAFFYKLWNPSYAHRDNILAAIDAAFYDERLVPALHAVVQHDGVCRGYVMHEGTTRHGESINCFRQLLQQRTSETGFFFLQFAPHHTMTYDGRLSLLDLEAVFPVSDLPLLSPEHCAFEDDVYRKHVAELYQHSGARNGDVHPLVMLEHVSPGSPAARRFFVRPARRIKRRLRNLKPMRHLIQR